MKPTTRLRAGAFLVLLGILGLAGCGGDNDADSGYGGAWRGGTSHGGTVVFTVDGYAVTTLQVVDKQARVQIMQPVSIKRGSFSVENFENASLSGNPLVSLHGTFDSQTHCSGRYSITAASDTWSGTFEASPQ